MWYTDGVEGEVIKDLLARFMKDNPGINVILDDVGYKVVQEQLPVGARGRGAAPTSPASPTSRHWLTTCSTRRPTLPILPTGRPISAISSTGRGRTARRPSPDSTTQLTLTGGFANKTLFEQAGVCCRALTPPGRQVGRGGRKGAGQPADQRSVRDRLFGPPHLGPNVPHGAYDIGVDGLPAPCRSPASRPSPANWSIRHGRRAE